MSKVFYYYCRPVTLRDEREIDVPSESMRFNYTYHLSIAGAAFVKNAGNNAMAFVKECLSAKLLLLCNKETGELFILDSYSEMEKVEIRQQFIRYLFSACQSLNPSAKTYQIV